MPTPLSSQRSPLSSSMSTFARQGSNTRGRAGPPSPSKVASSSAGRRAASPTRRFSNSNKRGSSPMRRPNNRSSISSRTKSTSAKNARTMSKGELGRTRSDGNHHENCSRAVARRTSSLVQSDHSRSSRTETKGLSKPERKKGTRPGQVSAFLRTTHRDLKDQISTLQGHIRFIQDLATMNENRKVELLFEMVDGDGGGTVDAEELATAMRQNDELSFSDSIEKAIDMVATFDENGDGELDKTEFKNYVKAMVHELGVTVPEFAELLVVQVLLANPEDRRAVDKENIGRERITEEVKRREKLFKVLSTSSLKQLFQLFDGSSHGEVAFGQVAKSFFQCKQGMEKSVQDALDVLLMVGKNDTRKLDYEQFGRLIMKVVETTNTSLEDIATSLTLAVESKSMWEDEFGENHFGNGSSVLDGSSFFDQVDGLKIDSLTQGRLKKLFKLWDADGDGDISRSELANGLRVFQRIAGVQVDAEAVAKALIKFDEDGDNHLDPREFSHAMINFAKQFGVELHDLIDFMCLSSALGDKMEDFHQAYGLNLCSLASEGDDSLTELNEFDDEGFLQGDVDFWD